MMNTTSPNVLAGRIELAPILGIDRGRGISMYFGPSRQIDHFELSRRLKGLARAGVQVPTLMFSKIMPLYVNTTEGGVEVYQPGNILVPAGCVIDSHGNVVDLHALEQQASNIELIPGPKRIPFHNPLGRTPVNLRAYTGSRNGISY